MTEYAIRRLLAEAEAENARLRAVVEAVRPYMTLLPVEVAEGIIGIEPIDYVNQESDRMRAALSDISRAVMPDVGHGGNYGFVVAAAEALVAELARLRDVVEAVQQWRAAEPGQESAVAIQAVEEALVALDVSGEGSDG